MTINHDEVLQRPAAHQPIPDDPQLLKLLEEAAARVLTPEEQYEQRINFIMGHLGRKSSLTRDEVERYVGRNHFGRCPSCNSLVPSGNQKTIPTTGS